MTTLKMILLSAAVLSVGATAVMMIPGTDTTAHALKVAGHIDAQSDYWETIASIANQPGNHAALLQDAKDERDEAHELVNDQFDARMEVVAVLGNAIYQPNLQPNEFSSTVTNTYMPLIVGRILTYKKVVGTDVEEIVVTTEPGSKNVNGIDCAIVRDTVTLNGVFLEDTYDWFAQRNDGNVWYLGEISMNFDEDGFVEDIEGSWRYGKDGAQPGIVMMANPQVGDAYRQEYWIGEAEDVGRVIAVGVSVTVPAGTYHNCIVTQDWVPLEPDGIEHKYFAPGVGLVLELDPDSGERTALISIQ
ncbi:MAG: hypothetical protein O3A20_10825, partial [Planctomycetota bacterium]|nr:hypothetical protein [Planctomycetota bacterium]